MLGGGFFQFHLQRSWLEGQKCQASASEVGFRHRKTIFGMESIMISRPQVTGSEKLKIQLSLHAPPLAH